MNEVTELLNEQALQKNIKIAVDVPEDHLIFGDKNMISTIIRNILSNSIKYTYSGGKIEVTSARKEEGFVTIAIADQGMGMDESTLKKLFALDKGPSVKGTNKETGTGLGMIISQEFAMMNKGIITAESKLGEGSTFFVKLPNSNIE